MLHFVITEIMLTHLYLVRSSAICLYHWLVITVHLAVHTTALDVRQREHPTRAAPPHPPSPNFVSWRRHWQVSSVSLDNLRQTATVEKGHIGSSSCKKARRWAIEHFHIHSNRKWRRWHTFRRHLPEQSWNESPFLQLELAEQVRNLC